jgi:ankyrin repeat protein
LDIFEASKRGDLRQIKYLVEHEKLDVNKRDPDGASALMFAAMRGHVVR